MKIDEQEYQELLTPDEVERLLTPDPAADETPQPQDADRGEEAVIDFIDQPEAESIDDDKPAPTTCRTKRDKRHTEVQTVRQKAIAAIDDDVPWNLRNIVAAEVLNSRWLRRQWKFAAFLVLLAIVHISDRYGAQQQLLEIDQLEEQKKDLTIRLNLRQTELLQMSRQSIVLETLEKTQDSILHLPKTKPFILEQE